MKKILLLSDTHSYLDEAMLTHIERADEVWHAGDIGNLDITDEIQRRTTLRAVHGNIDNQLIRAEFPQDQYFTIENTRVWMTHIGGYPRNYQPRIRAQFNVIQPDIFICGHSHILKVIYDKQYKLLHLNPGAAGKHGFHKVRTMLRFEIHEDGLKHMDIIELEKRA